MYAYFKRLDYFSTECVYAPFAARGFARDLVKDLEVGGVGVEWIVLEKVGGLIWVKVTDSIDVVHSAEPWTVAAAPLSPRPSQRAPTVRFLINTHLPGGTRFSRTAAAVAQRRPRSGDTQMLGARSAARADHERRQCSPGGIVHAGCTGQACGEVWWW